MKRSGLISLICSLVAVMVLCLSVILVLIFTDVISIVPEELVISSPSATATYDGEALIDQNWSLLKGELKENHRLSVVVSGSQTNVGISENYIFATVLDENGADVSEDYNIVYMPGTLNIKQRVITLTADSKIKVYDGEPLTADGYTLDSKVSLVKNHELSVTVEGSITEIGVADNVITSVVVRNSKGDDVTKNYRIKTVDGKLAVYSPDTLIFETESEVFEYTGEPLVNKNWHQISGKLLAGDTIHVEVTGSQLNVGTSENTIEVLILNSSGEDVTSRYEIVYDLGELTVIKKEITITSNSAQMVYNGSALTDNGFTVEPGCVPLSQIALEVYGSQTEVGSSPNRMTSAVIYNSVGEDVTSNYKINYVEGTLTVHTSDADTLTELTFMSASDKKEYDGEALTCKMWKITEGALKDGHSASVTVIGAITDVGIEPNDFNVQILDGFGNDVTDEYLIRKETGDLAVTKAHVTVTSASDQKTYDGEPLVNQKYNVSLPEYAEKFDFNVEVIGSQTMVGTSDNTISSCIIFDKNGNNVTRNFEVKKVEGELTVVAAEEELKLELTYKTGSSTKAYDGTPLANDECYRILGELLEGHSERFVMASTITEVGKIENTVTVYIYDGDVDVTD